MLVGIWNKNGGKKTYLYLITGKSPLKMSTQRYGGSQKGNSHAAKKTVTTYKFY